MNESENTNAADQSQLVIKASNFTGGDVDKAKAMVAGHYKDIKVVKGKFAITDADLYGFFLIFLKIDDDTISNISMNIISNPEYFSSCDIEDKWTSCYSKFLKMKEEIEMAEGDELVSHMAESITGYDLFSYVKENDTDAIIDIFVENLRKFYSLPNIDCIIKIDESSSIEMIDKGLEIGNIYKEKPKKDNEKEIKLPGSEIESKYSYKIDAKVLVSPVKGKYINDIADNEMIRVLPLKDTVLAKKIANAQKAIGDNNEILPLRAKVIKKAALEDGGYVIYALVANNVLAKIIEEENVKIELYNPQITNKNDEKSNKLIMYVALLAGMIICIFILLLILI